MVSTVSVAMMAPVATGGAVARLLGAGVLARVRGREALHNSIPGKHSAIYGEVPAYHEGPHSCVLLGKSVRFVREIRLVLASIDQNEAGVAIVVTVAFVRRVLPPSSPAETYEEPC